MKTECTELMSHVALKIAETKTLCFREINKPIEIEDFLKLRYLVYCESGFSPLLKQNEHHVDMDIWDLHSRFFGIYVHEELIAGARIVIHKEDYFNREVYEIGRKFGLYNDDKSSRDKLLQMEYADFPFLSYPGVPNEIKQFYADQRKTKKVFMVSRCVIHPDHRGLKTMQFLTEGIASQLSIFCGDQVGLAMSDVSISHSKFYGRYGYYPVEAAPVYDLKGIPVTCLAIYLSTNLRISSFPEHLHQKLEEMIAEYHITGAIQRVID